jgi:signal transduction histidine kinase/CheY-like chemotaxis protein
LRSALRARARQYEIRALLDAREKAAAKLEALVAERTRALQDANSQLLTEVAERARAEQHLRRAQRIEVLGQLTGGIAHDFNNLLMVISGGLQMLRRRSDPELRERLMDGMQQAANRGASLVRQLLAFSRRQELKPEPIDIARRIGGMRELLDRSLRGDVHVEFEFENDLWTVEVDAGEFELVLLNLAVNARDAMPGGGAITVRAENCSGLETESLRGDYVHVSVTDTGAGMPPDVLARAFEPFYTTKDVGKGSGLGLAQVHGFASQSRGAVRIDSVVGRGTTVSLYLPRSDKAPADQPSADLRAGPGTQFKGSVLLVEDDNEVAKLASEMLRELGFDVFRVGSAKAALGALANGRAVDVVFSDIMMPGGMNGVELASEIRKRRAGLPVLLTSGYADAAKLAAQAEGVRILPKPYRLEDLSAALANLTQHVSGA